MLDVYMYTHYVSYEIRERYRMLNRIGPHYERQENDFGERGFGNETVVDRVLPEMMHLIDPTW